GNGTTTDPTDLQSAVTSLGGGSLPNSKEGQNQNYVPPAVVIGIPGTQGGQAYQASLPMNSTESFPAISGYLTRSSTSQDSFEAAFTFAPSDYIPFSMNSTTGAITVGCYPRSMTCGNYNETIPSPGFGVVVVDAYSLEGVGNEMVFNANDSGSDPESLPSMANYLSNFSGDPSKLVFIVSHGEPEPNAANYVSWNQVAQQVQNLGGNITTFNTFNGSGATSGVSDFGLVGGNGIAGSAQDQAGGVTGQPNPIPLLMKGVLTRSNTWQFYPIASAPLGVFSMQLMPTAYQPASPWPDSTPPYTKVQSYIASLFCLEPSNQRCTQPADIRSQYWQRDQSWTGMATSLNSLHYPTHVVTITGKPNAGTFTLTWTANNANHTAFTTKPIPWNATANQVQAFLARTQPNGPMVNVRVAGGPGTGNFRQFLFDMTAEGSGTLSGSGSNLFPSGGVSATACSSSNQSCPGVGFTRTQLATMSQLFTNTEWPAVDEVGQLMDNLYSPFGAGGLSTYVDVEGISSAIEKAVTPSNNPSTLSKVFGTLQDAISIASSIAGFFKNP